MYCSRRLYKGNAYEICLPIADTGITVVRFYTRGDIILEKEPETTGDSMCFSFTEEDLASLEDGVLRYGYDDFDTNSPYVVVTPGDYSGSTLDDLLEDAYDSGYTAGQEDCSGGTCEGVWESGYTSGYTDGVDSIQELTLRENITDNGEYAWAPLDGLYKEVYLNVNVPQTGHTDQEMQDSWDSGYTSGYTDGQNACSGSSCNIQAVKAYNILSSDTRIFRGKAAEANKFYISQNIAPGPLTAITPDAGYDGIGQVNIGITRIEITSVYNSGVTEGFASGYTSGYTDGLNACSGYTQEDLDNAYASGYSAGIEACSGSPEPVYSAMPLTMEITSPGYILYKDGSQTGYFSGATISYSMDSGVTWTTISGLTGGTQIQVSSGDTVMFKGDNATYGTNGLGFLGFSNSTAGFKVYGNIMSLIDSQGFISATTLSSQWTFAHLFADCTGLTDASNLVLPATSLSFGCYEQLFLQCTNLVSAPELPATVLSPYCYELMFGFTNLIEAPVLCATTLTDHCYFAMFRFCGSLQKVVCYATDISANDCTVDWLKGVPAEGTFEKAPGMTSWPSGSAGIPTGWTVVDAT